MILGYLNKTVLNCPAAEMLVFVMLSLSLSFLNMKSELVGFEKVMFR